jgi:hypothetical protein
LSVLDSKPIAEIHAMSSQSDEQVRNSPLDNSHEFAGHDSDSLVRTVTIFWKYRFLCIACVVLGGLCGAYAGFDARKFRSTGICRMSSPGISHTARNYWDTEGKAKILELKAIASARYPEYLISARIESEPWLIRLEVDHEEAGAGRIMFEEILDDPVKGVVSQTQRPMERGTSPYAEAFRESLIQLEQKLAEISQTTKGQSEKMPSGNSDVRRVAITSFESRLPIEDLAHYDWYVDLKARVARVYMDTAGSSDVGKTEQFNEIARQLEAASQKLHLYWTTSDLTSSVRLPPDTSLTQVSEQPKTLSQAVLKASAMGVWAGLLMGFLLSMVVHWLSQHWPTIKSGNVPVA